MKKNKMMRVASALLIAVLLTTSAISGTFAKYVTTNSGTDTARVAKFGVEIAINNDLGLFDVHYAKHDTSSTYTGTYTVEAATVGNEQDQVVAPGTNGSMTFTISGTPEVATKVDFAFDIAHTITLPIGSYSLAAGKYMADAQTVTTTAAYEPIYFYLYEGTRPASPDKLTLSDLETQFENISGTYAPNTNLAKTYTLEWAWDFEGSFTAASGITGVTNYADFLDTYLGDQDTLQTEEFTFSVTVTQID